MQLSWSQPPSSKLLSIILLTSFHLHSLHSAPLLGGIIGGSKDIGTAARDGTDVLNGAHSALNGGAAHDLQSIGATASHLPPSSTDLGTGSSDATRGLLNGRTGSQAPSAKDLTASKNLIHTPELPIPNPEASLQTHSSENLNPQSVHEILNQLRHSLATHGIEPETISSLGTLTDAINSRLYGLKDLSGAFPEASHEIEPVTETAAKEGTGKSLEKEIPLSNHQESSSASESLSQTSPKAEESQSLTQTERLAQSVTNEEKVSHPAAEIESSIEKTPDLIGTWGRLTKIIKQPFRWAIKSFRNWKSKGYMVWLAENKSTAYVQEFARLDPFYDYAVRMSEKRGIWGHVLFEKLGMVDRTHEVFPKGGPLGDGASKAWKYMKGIAGSKEEKVKIPPITDEPGITGSVTHDIAAHKGLQQGSTHQNEAETDLRHSENAFTNSEKQATSIKNPSSDPARPNHLPDPLKEEKLPTNLNPESKQELRLIPKIWKSFTTPFRWISKRIDNLQTRRNTRFAAYYLRYLSQKGPEALRARINADPQLVAIIQELEKQLAAPSYVRQGASATFKAAKKGINKVKPNPGAEVENAV